MITVSPTTAGLAAAAQALREERLVVYPTETVYGLGADPFSENALKRLYAKKARDPSKPVLLIVSGMAQLDALIEGGMGTAAPYAEAFWPGPLSLLFRKAPGIPAQLAGHDGRVCIRCPASTVARDLCKAFGGAVTSTSVNRSGERPALSLAEIDGEGLAVGIDGGVLKDNPPSTVFDPESGTILRQGAITREALLEIGG